MVLVKAGANTLAIKHQTIPAFANITTLGVTNRLNMLREINEDEFTRTMQNGMTDVTGTVDAVTDIWSYVEDLVKDCKISRYVLDNFLVEKVYRSRDQSFDHVLLPTELSSTFVVLFIDLARRVVLGHHTLNIENCITRYKAWC
jgi:hypothetical protein